ncbi:MAG: glycoside hydrolase [Verrucomicrobiales bacterium]|nr:glycoside hydrolase [Verrucomicrobiales bacterium]
MSLFWTFGFWFTAIVATFSSLQLAAAENARELPVAQLTREPRAFTAKADESGAFTWWLPPKADALVLPISAGTLVDTSNEPLMRWLKDRSPWDLSKLPLIGARYGERTVVVIVPWPHYAELVIQERIGIRFRFPAGRNNTTACEIVAGWRGLDPMEVAHAFRNWRESATDTGAIPKPRSLAAKAAQLPAVARLFGAPHIYLWGPALFSRHDVERARWTAFARALRDGAPDSFAGRLVARFSADQRRSLDGLADSEWPATHLTLDVATAINSALSRRALLELPAETALRQVVQRNSEALADAMREFVGDPKTWGDGFSLPILEGLRESGIDRAVLLLSDLYGNAPKPGVMARASELGFLLGPYDSYHSVHDPEAAPDETWATAQFDRAAYATGRILNADGSGHAGFKDRGFHLSPLIAKPYVQRRVEGMLRDTPFNAWFVDCDAAAECFDDFHPAHPATRVDDIQARRERLHWLESSKRLVVGSEDGSVMFADVFHFGHGIHTPYLGHLAREFKDPKSAHFLGGHWPSDTPAHFFKRTPLPPALRSPYFDPLVRIPLYQAALGDEIIVSHHWSLDSLKLDEVEEQRQLMELLYMVPPLYHLNRETWPLRRERIVRHFKFWSPRHRKLATAPLIRFEWLTPDRLLQRTTFRLPDGEATMTVNFSDVATKGFPPKSATAGGNLPVGQIVF